MLGLPAECLRLILYDDVTLNPDIKYVTLSCVLSDRPQPGQNPRGSGPLFFHRTHGCNVKMSEDMRQATRVKGYHKAVCFSNRPVGVNEQVHIKISNVWTERFGVIRFGYTALNPSKISRAKLPSSMSDGFTKKPGYIAMELPAKCVIKDKVLSFYVTPTGSVTYAVCGVEEGTLFSGVDTSRPLWVVIDIYANTSCVEFVGGLRHVFNPYMFTRCDVPLQKINYINC